MGKPFSKFKPFCAAFVLGALAGYRAQTSGAKQFLELHPKPALLFSLQKSKQKASPLGTYKTYFEPGVLQLPTVKQIKRLYNSVQNRFYKQVLKGSFNYNGKQQTANNKQQWQNNEKTEKLRNITTKTKRKNHKNTRRLIN